MLDENLKHWYDCVIIPGPESVTEVVLCRTELVQMEKPQPVKPELTSRPITGVLDMLNKFRG